MFCVIPIPAFKDNYIWLLHNHRRAIVVDPGDAAPVLQFLNRLQLALSAILITHHHWDHINGIADLQQHYPESLVYGPAMENIPHCNFGLADGDMVMLTELGLALRVMAVPGHTLGHIAYYDETLVFCGDTLFAAGCGRLFEGTAAQLHTSLKKLAGLPGDTLVYCTHEYSFTNLTFALTVEPANSLLQTRLTEIRQRRMQNEPSLPSCIRVERLTNPFLRCHETVIKQAVEHHHGQTLATELEVFTALRRWKDNF